MEGSSEDDLENAYLPVLYIFIYSNQISDLVAPFTEVVRSTSPNGTGCPD